jgi:hypothetical protein
MTFIKRAAAIAIAVVFGVALAPLMAHAQESRAALIESAQAAKARALVPYEPNKAEQIAANLKKRLLDSPQGLYPWFDSVYSGGGFTGGAGYRRFVSDSAFIDVRGLLSAKGYKLIELVTDSLGQNRRLQVRGVGGWRDATQVAFYGVGSGTSVDDVTNFQMQQTYAGVSGRVRGPARLFSEIEARYENYVLLEGNGSSPSIEQVHTPASAPGLGASPSYLRSTIAGGAGLRAQRWALRGYLRRRHGHRRWGVLVCNPAGRSGPARSRPAGELGVLFSRRGANHRRRRRHGAVFPDAIAGQRQHAAGVSKLAVSRSP